MSSWRSLTLNALASPGATPLAASAWRTQFRMLVAWQPNSLGQYAGLTPGTNQFNHLLTKLRRIRRLGGMRFAHFGLLLQEQ
jgi:hypothetical protein